MPFKMDKIGRGKKQKLKLKLIICSIYIYFFTSSISFCLDSEHRLISFTKKLDLKKTKTLICVKKVPYSLKLPDVNWRNQQ